MDFNEILNSVIAGLIITLITTVSAILFKILKSKYIKSDKFLFLLNSNIYINLLLIIFSGIMIDKNSLFTNLSNIIFLFDILLSVYNVVFSHKNSCDYIKYSSCNRTNTN